MGEMIERAAKALYALTAEPDHGDKWDTISEEWRENFRLHAYTVLASIQEPSQAGKIAVWDCLEGNAKAGNCKPGRMRGNGMPTAFLRMMMEAEATEFVKVRRHQKIKGAITCPA